MHYIEFKILINRKHPAMRDCCVTDTSWGRPTPRSPSAFMRRERSSGSPQSPPTTASAALARTRVTSRQSGSLSTSRGHL